MFLKQFKAMWWFKSAGKKHTKLNSNKFKNEGKTGYLLWNYQSPFTTVISINPQAALCLGQTVLLLCFLEGKGRGRHLAQGPDKLLGFVSKVTAMGSCVHRRHGTTPLTLAVIALSPLGWWACRIYFSTWNAIRGFTLFLLQKQHHKNPWWLELQLS